MHILILWRYTRLLVLCRDNYMHGVASWNMALCHAGLGADPDNMCLNSLWPSDIIWWQRSGSTITLTQIMACCQMAPSHYLNQCWLIISEVLWHSPEVNSTGSAQYIYLSLTWVWKLLINYLWLQLYLPGANELIPLHQQGWIIPLCEPDRLRQPAMQWLCKTTKQKQIQRFLIKSYYKCICLEQISMA